MGPGKMGDTHGSCCAGPTLRIHGQTPEGHEGHENGVVSGVKGRPDAQDGELYDAVQGQRERENERDFRSGPVELACGFVRRVGIQAGGLREGTAFPGELV